jgi:flavin-dependent dehydrogenase
MVAMRLAASGRRVTLLEKERSVHHKVCGEFLSREAIDYLLQVGIDPLHLGAAAIRFVRLSSKRKVVEAALPFPALSLSRLVLDEAMLTRAAEVGCDVRRGVLVEKLTAQGDKWFAEVHQGEALWAHTVFLANGKHDLRGWSRVHGKQGDLIGFKLHWRLAPSQTQELRDFIELFLFSGGYGGLSLVEEDVANLCLVVRRAEWRRVGGWTELLAAILGENQLLRRRLQGAKALWERPLAISPIPYGYLDGRPSGLWCVGDQAAVIPSFTGDGMSIALHSAALAAKMYLAGEGTDLYYRTLRSQLSSSMRLATWLSRVMVTGPGRTMAPFGLSIFPEAMRWIAASTRVPEQALLANHASSSASALGGT